MRKAARPRTLLAAWALVLVTLVAGRASAQETTLWISPLTTMTHSSSVTIGLGQPSQAARITVSTPGTYDVLVPLFVPSNKIVKSVEICYWSSNTVNYIDRIIVGQAAAPAILSPNLQDDTNLNSGTPVCYTTTVATTPNPYAPTGSTLLQLTLEFTSAVGVIDLGAIGVNMEPAP